MAWRIPRGLRRVRLAAGTLVLAVVLLAIVGRQGRIDPLRPSPFRGAPALPPSAANPAAPRLERLVRRYSDSNVILEVIYANPLLPADEATNPVFRIVAVYRRGSTAPADFPPDLRRGAELRASDGALLEGQLWQEEVRRGNQVLGYLSFRADEHHPWITRRTRWIELSLRGVTSRPLRLRWPVHGSVGK